MPYDDSPFRLDEVGVLPPPMLAPEPSMVRPFTAAEATAAARELAQRPPGFRFCVTGIDHNLFELGPKDFVTVVGYAHTGKTMFTLSAVAQQLDRRVLWITPDESPQIIHRRMIGFLTGAGPHEVEGGYAGWDQQMADRIDSVNEKLGNLLMFDECESFAQLDQIIASATQTWEADPHVLVFDYLTCLPHQVGQESKLAMRMKMWARPKPFPVVVIHQSSRHAGKNGQEMELWSGEYGGERESIISIGLSRPSDDPDNHGADPQVLIAKLMKNKHTGALTKVQLRQDPITGYVYEPHPSYMYRQGEMPL